MSPNENKSQTYGSTVRNGLHIKGCTVGSCFRNACVDFTANLEGEKPEFRKSSQPPTPIPNGNLILLLSINNRIKNTIMDANNELRLMHTYVLEANPASRAINSHSIGNKEACT